MLVTDCLCGWWVGALGVITAVAAESLANLSPEPINYRSPYIPVRVEHFRRVSFVFGPIYRRRPLVVSYTAVYVGDKKGPMLLYGGSCQGAKGLGTAVKCGAAVAALATTQHWMFNECCGLHSLAIVLAKQDCFMLAFIRAGKGALGRLAATSRVAAASVNLGTATRAHVFLQERGW